MSYISKSSLFLVSLLVNLSLVKCQVCSGGFKGDPNDCSVYYQCSNGVWVKMSCPSGLQWNSNGNYCDWPNSAGCNSNNVTTLGTTTKVPPITSSTTQKPTVSTTTPSSGSLITQSQFQCAAQTKGGNPDSSYYTGFINSLPKASISTKSEGAKFLAHAVWETVGFQYTKEVYCQTNLDACRAAYPSNSGGRPDKVYYGRGMLQLTWDYNYMAASKYLYGDDRLIQNPETVSDVPSVGWATAAWFWMANVHVNAATFGNTLKAINGALECDGGPSGQNMILRFSHYKQVLTCLSMPLPLDSDGYCHA